MPVEIDKLIFIKVENYLSTFEFENGQHIHRVEPLKYIEKKLSNNFFRINRNYLVNINKIELIDKKRGEITVKNQIYKISTQNIKILLKKYKKI